MQFKTLALLAVAGTAAAEFVIITSTPIPTNLAVLADPTSYISSVRNYIETALGSLSTGSALSAALSAHEGLVSFAATATQFTIPSDVTKVDALETLGSIPAWYSALPSDVKSYYDEHNSLVQSILVEAIAGKQTDATTSVSGKASNTGAAAASGTTGAAAASGTTGAAAEKIVGILGAGVAAAFAGVMAL